MIFLFLKFWYLVSSASADIWSKCSKPCGIGEQVNENGVKRKCNFEDCSVYDGQFSILNDGRMNDISKWQVSGWFLRLRYNVFNVSFADTIV